MDSLRRDMVSVTAGRSLRSLTSMLVTCTLRRI